MSGHLNGHRHWRAAGTASFEAGPSVDEGYVAALTKTVGAGGTMTDEDFDAIYPAWIRRASDMHWTPYAVARRAADLLVVNSSTRVLDVGSGPGKFCLIGSMATQGHFYGVEQRPGLVSVANAAASTLGSERAVFIHGDIESVDWGAFDAFYLYNPFCEHIYDVQPHIEEPIVRSSDAFIRYVELTRLRLGAAPVGTRVAMYQGYGGAMPVGYRSVVREMFEGHDLELWVKELPTRDVPPWRVLQPLHGRGEGGACHERQAVADEEV